MQTIRDCLPTFVKATTRSNVAYDDGGLTHDSQCNPLDSSGTFLSMKVLTALLVLLTTGWPTAAEAQGIKAYGVATNFTADNKVLELTVPPELDGERFVVVWNSGKDQSLAWQIARAGTHSY